MTDTRPVSLPPHLPAPPDPTALPLPHPARPADGVRLLRGAVYPVHDGSRPHTDHQWQPPDPARPLPDLG
ncbi:hypothetical protein ACE14D_06310 [Streptomyces sp. Act-28]